MSTDSSSILLAFLGASNLARGYTALSHFIVRRLAPHPVECFSAFGPGRGYAATGGVLNITFPPIAECGLLEAVRLRVSTGARTLALLTDIGNDIMYGLPPAEIIACLEKIIKQILAMDGQVLATPISLDVERDVGRRAFRILRTVYFPKSRMTMEQAAQAVAKINAFLYQVRSERVHLLDGMSAFRGCDKIHYAVLKNSAAWTRVGDEMLRLLGAEPRPPRRIGTGRMLHSFGCNLGRLIFVDELRLMPRPGNQF